MAFAKMVKLNGSTTQKNFGAITQKRTNTIRDTKK
jgi:hypothetical protein